MTLFLGDTVTGLGGVILDNPHAALKLNAETIAVIFVDDELNLDGTTDFAGLGVLGTL